MSDNDSFCGIQYAIAVRFYELHNIMVNNCIPIKMFCTNYKFYGFYFILKRIRFFILIQLLCFWFNIIICFSVFTWSFFVFLFIVKISEWYLRVVCVVVVCLLVLRRYCTYCRLQRVLFFLWLVVVKFISILSHRLKITHSHTSRVRYREQLIRRKLILIW